MSKIMAFALSDKDFNFKKVEGNSFGEILDKVIGRKQYKSYTRSGRYGDDSVLAEYDIWFNDKFLFEEEGCEYNIVLNPATEKTRKESVLLGPLVFTKTNEWGETISLNDEDYKKIFEEIKSRTLYNDSRNEWLKEEEFKHALLKYIDEARKG